ncbi:MAG: hypothetical protein JST22_00080 [Bacteroidetes bacterium]|nr:hypothetical protein [Bacteroidota bacterium]
MFPRILVAACLFLAAIPSLTAQHASIWKHLSRPEFGVGLITHTLAETDTTAATDIDSRIDVKFLQGIIGFDLPVVYLADQLALGINPNFEAGLVLNQEGFTGSLEAPIYATLKYGTDATWQGSRSPVGFSIGAGYRFTALFTDGPAYSYGVPQFMAELNFGKRRSEIGLIKLRYSMSIGKAHDEIGIGNGLTAPIVYSNYALQLVFVPGY